VTGTAAFIPVARPWVGEREADAARRAILSGWTTQGPEVAAFEGEFAAYVGTPHACAVSSGTTALHLALLAVGVEPGDEVVTVSHSFIATANAIRYCGATPVFADIDPATFNMDPARAESAIGSRTRAILAVHQLGMPCDLAALSAIAARHGLPLVEDAACAIGSEIAVEGRWERIGRPRGAVACFSLHPRKLLSTGDGGVVTTSDVDIDRRIRLLRQHGMGENDRARHAAREVTFESYEVLGYNYRLTDIQGAIGREQLARLPEAIARRRALAARYHTELAAIPGLQRPCEPDWARSNYQSYCVRLPAGSDQRSVMQHLLDARIATRRGVMCAHREPAYPAGTWSARGSLVESERAQDHGVILPLFHDLSDDDQDRVVAALASACRQ
jgi:dTDP-4-amino-4,6-dideoxygalactose transaminase